MTSENASVAAPEPTGMGELSRLSGVFFEPGKAFADIAARPRWLVPMILIILGIIAFNAAYGSHVGWRTLVMDQLDTPKAAERMQSMTAEQRQQAIAMQEKIMPFVYYIGPVLMPLAFLMSAGLMMGMLATMSGGLRFKQVFAITCYAGLVGIVANILGIVVMFLKSPDQVNFMNPLAFNPAAFMDPKSSSKFLYTLGTGLDLFKIWGAVLTAIGIKVAAGNRISSGGAALVVFVPYAVLLLVGATLAGAFS
ncbi:MAG: Yip1 family protein [Bryobacteraceae bacterium]